MRRSDREITDRNIIEELIASQQILRIAFYDAGDIYIVPVNYGYLYENGSYRFYFHGAMAGRKYELSKARPTVGFEIDGKYALQEHEVACKFSAAFQSVIGTGTLRIVGGREEKKIGLNALMKQAARNSDWAFDEKIMESVAVFRLDVDKMSCKAK